VLVKVLVIFLSLRAASMRPPPTTNTALLGQETNTRESFSSEIPHASKAAIDEMFDLKSHPKATLPTPLTALDDRIASKVRHLSKRDRQSSISRRHFDEQATRQSSRLPATE